MQKKEYTIPYYLTKLLANHQNYHNNQSHIIKQIISLHDKYHQQKKNNNPIIQQKKLIQNTIIMIIGIREIIDNQDYDPYSKLLALRLIKDSLFYGDYTIWAMTAAYILQSTYTKVLSKQNNRKDKQGYDMFLHYQKNKNNVHSSKYLKQIGLSYLQMVLQMHQSLSNCMQFWPFNHTITTQLQSLPYQQFQDLKNKRVKFPAERTYYKQKQIHKLENKFQYLISQKYNRQQQISDFYETLSKLIFDEESIDNETRQYYQQVLLSLIKSGDINWNKTKFFWYLKQDLLNTEHHQNILSDHSHHVSSSRRLNDIHKKKQKLALKLCHKIFMTANLFAVVQIQNKLILTLFQNFAMNEEVYKQKQLLFIWGGLASRCEILKPRLNILIQVANSLLICDPSITTRQLEYDKMKYKQLIEIFQKNLENQHKNNKILDGSALLNSPHKHSEDDLRTQIQKLMKNYMMSSPKKVRKFQQTIQKQTTSQFIDIKHQVLQSQQNSQENDLQIKIDSELISLQSPQKNTRDKYISKDSSKYKLNKLQNIINVPLIIQNTFSQYHSKNSSIDRGSRASSRKSRGKGLILSHKLKKKQQLPMNIVSLDIDQSSPQIHYDMITKLQKELIQSRKRNFNLQRQNKTLKKLQLSQIQIQANYQIPVKSVKSVKSIQKLDALIQTEIQIQKPDLKQSKRSESNSHQKINLTNNNTNYLKTPKIQNYTSKRMGSPIRSNLPKSFHKVVNKIFDFQSSRHKKDILRNKNLIMKNGDLQIGLITSLQSINNSNNFSQLQMCLYVTALRNVQQIFLQLKIRDNPYTWLKITRSQNTKTKNIKQQQQYICKYIIKCCESLHGTQRQHQQIIDEQIIESINSPILLTGRYRNQSSQNFNDINIKTPIFITKFIENIAFKSDYSNDEMLQRVKQLHLKYKQNPLSSFINKDTKILRDFSDFQKYFPQSRNIHDNKYIANIRLVNNQEIWLVVELLCKNEIEISFLRQSINNREQIDFIESIIFKGYCSLFGI